MTSLLVKTNSTQMNSMSEDKCQQDLEEQIKRLSTQNEQIYQNTLYRDSSTNNYKIQKELSFIKSSIQNLKNDLKNFDGTQSSCRQLCSSNKSSFKSYSSQLDQQKNNQIMERASIARKSQRTCTFDSLPDRRNTPIAIFVPLNKLFNSSYLQQGTSNSLKYFELDKRGQLCGPKNFIYKNKIKTDLDSLLNQSFYCLNDITTLTFYLMNGCSKQTILHRMLEKINYLIDSEQIDQILIADGISIQDSKNLQGLLECILNEIEEPEVNLIQSIDDLYKVLIHQKQKFSELKQIISDQIKMEQGNNKKPWINCKLKRNIAFQIQYSSGKVLNILFFNDNLDSIQSQLKERHYINNPYSYFEVLRSIRSSQSLDNRIVLGLNPNKQNNQQVGEYLKFAKSKEYL